MLATAVQATGDRALGRTKRAGGLPIGETDQVNRDHRIAVGLGGAGDRLHQLARADRARDRVRAVFLKQGSLASLARCAAIPAGVRVLERSHEVADIGIAAHQPRPLEDLDERLLDEVLGFVA
jgi:hypothetical protein